MTTPAPQLMARRREAHWAFRVGERPTQIDRLISEPLVINGVSADPAWSYLLHDYASGSLAPRVGSETLTLSGSAPTQVAGICKGYDDQLFAGAGNLIGTTAGYGQGSTLDWVWFLLFDMSAGLEYLAAGGGWTIYTQSNRIKVAYTGATVIQSGVIATGARIPAFITLTRGATGGRIYGFGAYQNAGSTAGVGDLNATPVLALAGSTGGTVRYNGALTAAAAWSSDNASWQSDTDAILDTIAKSTLRCFGQADERGDADLISFGRSTTIYTPRRNSSDELEFQAVGPNVPVIGDWPTPSGNFVTGWWPQRAITNRFTAPNDLSDAAWTHTATSVSGAANGPSRDLPLDGVVATAVSTAHYFEQAITLAAQSTTIYVVAKAGQADHIYVSNETVANADGYLNLSTGTVGTTGAGLTAALRAATRDGTYLFEVRMAGAAGANTIRFAPSRDGADAGTFTGHGSSPEIYAGYFFGENVSHAVPYLTGAGASETLFFDPTSLPDFDPDAKRFTIAFMFMLPLDAELISSMYCLGLSDGVVADVDTIRAYIASGHRVGCFVNSTGSGGYTAINGDVDINDGEPHECRIVVQDGQPTRVFLDRSLASISGTVPSLPDALDRIMCGSIEASTKQPNFPIWDLRISYDAVP